MSPRTVDRPPSERAVEPEHGAHARASLPDFLNRYKETLRRLFRRRSNSDEMATRRGMPPFVMRDVLLAGPLSAFVPKEYGGRGGDVREGQAILEASSYESMALGLMMGISGGLFAQPVAKYGDPAMRGRVLRRLASGEAMGGLMITEPEFGSDALSMRTNWAEKDDRYHLVGTKHWGGLTGWADYWLVTARQRAVSGELARDVDIFVCAQDDPDQHIEVEEYFHNLGLWAIPYGRNRLDLRVPKTHRLQPRSTGITMLLDLLHRSRMQFPGMALGFIRRMLDEGMDHCRERLVGGTPLIEYDQVKARLATMQAQFTTVSAMCLYSAENAGLERDLAKEAIPANAIKSVCTDYMQSAAQSLLQLVGAKGYRLDHVAGRGVVDSRPFQIFEGSNDILYEQLSQSFIKGMRRVKEANLYQYLKTQELTSRAAEYFKDLLDFELDTRMPQRKLVEMGEVLGRIISIDLTLDMGSRGFHSDLINNAVTTVRQEVEARVSTFRNTRLADVVDSYVENSAWLSLVSPREAQPGLQTP